MTPKKTSGRCVTAIAIFGLVVICVVLGVVIWVATRAIQSKSNKLTTWNIGNLQITNSSYDIDLSTDGKSKLRGHLWVNGYNQNPTFTHTSQHELIVDWQDRRLSVTEETENNIQCYTIDWNATSCVSQVLKDCYHLDQAHWYGGYEDFHQHWPLEQTVRNTSAFIVGDTYDDQIGQVLERYFVSTNGIGIFLEHDIPLYISINETNDKRLCFSAKFENLYPYQNVGGKMPRLKYHICEGRNVREIHEYMSNRFWSKPMDIPDEKMFRYPIWSTWAQYHANISEAAVHEFSYNILRYNLSHSQLEIDDDWTTKYGDLDFDTTKFPNATEMVRILNSQGFRVTLWVHPFCNIDSQCFTQAAGLGYFIRQFESKLPAGVSWWQGPMAGILDVTNDAAVKWYLAKLEYLKQKYNISSFKFDAGGSAFLPKVFTSDKENSDVNAYTELFARMAYEADKNIRHQEVRVGYHTQDLPIFVRMLDLFSLWGRENGLEKLIPCALTFGVLGYPFVLPDMIGGNAYDNRTADKELFIRWLQVNTFLPAMQFSIAPWNYNDDEVINITRKYINLHAQYADVIINLARISTKTGAPIVRPLWWIAPDDPISQTIDSEYLLGDSILVAPVLKLGARQRDIYLPEGEWKDMLRNVTISGGWHHNYTAGLHELPFFTKQNP